MHKEKPHRFFPFMLFILGIVSVVFGVVQIYHRLYQPFALVGEPISLTRLQEQQQLNSIAAILALQNQDTDLDGLNDYDEIYSYRTSPYLKDSDSDGIDDKTELEQGYDPLCHKDQECDTALGDESFFDFNLGDELPGSADIQNLLGEFENPRGTDVNQLQAQVAGLDLSVQEIRELLIESGLSAGQVEALSDEDLLNTWQSVIGGL